MIVILVFIFLLTVMVGFTIIRHKLTVQGAITGALLATALFCGTGFPGVIFLACFFIAATIATSWKKELKSDFVLSENNNGLLSKNDSGHMSKNDSGPRNSLQVLANGGLAGLLGAIALVLPEHKDRILIIIASCLSAATADTISSELGSVYGKKFWNIVTLQPDVRGENGVVSLEGFLFGILGSCLISIAYWLSVGFNWSPVLVIIIAGTIGNIVDSLLGATLERNGKIKNDLVNFINTFCALIVALIFMWL